MFNGLLSGGDNKNPLVKQYKEYRAIGKEFNQKILKEFTDNRSLQTVGRFLGIWHGKTLVLESEEEMDFVMDFSLFEYEVQGKTFLQRYQERHTDLNPRERELLEATLSAYSSFFKITDANPANATLTFQDLFQSGREISLMDVNLSRTARQIAKFDQINLLIFTRVIPLPDFNMTSGMFCVFPGNLETTLMKRYKIQKQRVKSNKESIQRFVAFFKLNRTLGMASKTTEIPR
jgi:hypothetical protein